MWEKFTIRLGKVVQGVLNIFRKKKDNNAIEIENNETVMLVPENVTLHTISTEEWNEIENGIAWEDEAVSDLMSIGIVGELSHANLYRVDFEEPEEELLELLLKKLNTYKQDWPKRYRVKTLLVSVYTDWEYDSIGVDISRLDNGIAHYWSTTTQDMESAIRAYCEAHDVELWDEEDGNATVAVKDAVLLDWGGGYWTWEES